MLKLTKQLLETITRDNYDQVKFWSQISLSKELAKKNKNIFHLNLVKILVKIEN